MKKKTFVIKNIYSRVSEMVVTFPFPQTDEDDAQVIADKMIENMLIGALDYKVLEIEEEVGGPLSALEAEVGGLRRRCGQQVLDDGREPALADGLVSAVGGGDGLQ